MSKCNSISVLDQKPDDHDGKQEQIISNHDKRTDQADLSSGKDVNRTKLQDVFQAILRQVDNTDKELSFLAVLQHLLQIGQGNYIHSEAAWQTVEELVLKATSLEFKEDASRLLNTCCCSHRSNQGTCTCVHIKSRDDKAILAEEAASKDTSSPKVIVHSVPEQPPPASQLPPHNMSAIPPPPPPPPGLPGGPPPPPPPPGGSITSSMSVPDLPQFNIPRPRSRMKTLQWQKIPANNVIGKSNLWTIIGHLDKTYEMDYEKMDELFSLSSDGGSKRSNQDTDGTPESKRKKENAEINILDGKRSLNVNIFLKQFRMEHSELVQLIREGRCEKFGAERLKSLLKLLPSQEEIDSINAFGGDKDKLGNPEKFFVCLMKLPNYRMRIEGLLIMEEFNVNMEWIRPSIEAVIQAARDIQENQSLKELIYLILVSGNYLNSGNYAGNAAGFKLSSLLQLTEIRANKPGMNLMHYVAQEAQMKNPKLLKFPDEMKFLKDASQVSVETLTNDINNIATKVRAITDQIVVAGPDFQQQMAFFLKEANIEVVELEDDLKDIELMREELATFFCEDIKAFRLEECFRIMQTFCERLRKATEENIQRRIQEIKAEKRRSKDMENRRLSKDVTDLLDKIIDDQDELVLDKLLSDVRSGYSSRKFSDGHFSITKVTKVSLSPSDNASNVADMTDGSLRKKSRDSSSSVDGPFSPSDSLAKRQSRRSNTPGSTPVDDESLLDFLKNTDDVTAVPEKPESRFERYSSLRRRRLERKGKRNVLNVFERERAPSPSPNVANIKSSTTPTDSTPSGVKMRHSSNASRDRPKSEVFTDDPDSNRPLRRSQSVLDKSSIDKVNTDQRRKVIADDEDDESEALIRRLKQRLNRKSGRETPTINEEGDEAALRIDQRYFHEDSSPAVRNNSRWRSGITVSDTNLSPQPVKMNNFVSDSISADKTQNGISNQLNDNLDPDKFNPHLQDIHLQDIESSSSSESHKPSSNLSVSVSMRKKISSEMGTDIDGVLKTIEDTGRQIDTVGVTGPIQRTQDPSATKTPSHPQVAVVAHVTASNSPTAPISEMDTKTKKDNKKNMSTLSVHKVKPTRILSDSRKDIKKTNSANNAVVRAHSASHVRRTVSKPKTPPPPQVRLCKSRSKSDGENAIGTGNTGIKKDVNKTTQPAAKKKLQNSSVGAASDKNSGGKSQSNTSTKTLPSQSNTSTKTLPAGNTVVKRNSANRLSSDGRRNGLYLSDNDSDTENMHDVFESQGSPQFQNPESFSHHTSKSANASSETLQGGTSDKNNENSPVQKVVNRITMEDESDSPLAAVAKWKLKRVQQRRSVGDIIDENDSTQQSASYLSYNSNVELNVWKNDTGSRYSYASSNGRDEGFETASGATSQRTSLNSTLEAEILNNPALSRLADNANARNAVKDQLSTNFMVNATSKKDSLQISCLDSPDSGQNAWSDDTVPSSNSSKSASPAHQKVVSLGKKTATTDNANKSKKQSVPGYMLSTNSSASRPVRSRVSSTTDTPATPTVIKRSMPGRTSVRGQESVSNFKQDAVRASMRAETATAAFQRGTTARTSIRGPRTPSRLSVTSASSVLAPASLSGSRSESSSSISSIASSASNINASIASVTDTTRRRLASTSNTGAPIYRPTTPSGRPTTPSTRPTTPAAQTSTSSTRPTITVSQTRTAVIPPSQKTNGFTRSQSVRVTSRGRTSLGSDLTRSKAATPTIGSQRSVTPQPYDSRRGVTPLPNDPNQSTSPLLRERPHSTTPMSSEGKATKRFSFMAPTASSKARVDEQTSVAPPRAQSLTNISGTSPITRHASLRVSNKNSTTASGRKSPATTELSRPNKPDHHQSLSTVAEQAADEDKEAELPKKSSLIMKQIIDRSKVSTTGSRTSNRTSRTILVTRK